MITPDDDSLADARDRVAPECRATAGLVQLVLDGAAPAESLDSDPHATACATCRGRARAARVLLSVLAIPSEPAAVPTGFADGVLAALVADGKAESRRLATRHLVAKAAGRAALAAAVLLAVFALVPRPAPQTDTFAELAPFVAPEPAPVPEPAPAPREKVPAPPPRPMRIGDEVAKAGQALRDTPKPIADSVAVAPKLYEAFASAFRPAAPVAPMGDMLEPARKSLAELPDAARSGLEPVTGTAQKAFDRLLRDVALVKPKS